jgi:hypothetical protein
VCAQKALYCEAEGYTARVLQNAFNTLMRGIASLLQLWLCCCVLCSSMAQAAGCATAAAAAAAAAGLQVRWDGTTTTATSTMATTNAWLPVSADDGGCQAVNCNSTAGSRIIQTEVAMLPLIPLIPQQLLFKPKATAQFVFAAVSGHTVLLLLLLLLLLPPGAGGYDPRYNIPKIICSGATGIWGRVTGSCESVANMCSITPPCQPGANTLGWNGAWCDETPDGKYVCQTYCKNGWVQVSLCFGGGWSHALSAVVGRMHSVRWLVACTQCRGDIAGANQSHMLKFAVDRHEPQLLQLLNVHQMRVTRKHCHMALLSGSI